VSSYPTLLGSLLVRCLTRATREAPQVEAAEWQQALEDRPMCTPRLPNSNDDAMAEPLLAGDPAATAPGRDVEGGERPTSTPGTSTVTDAHPHSGDNEAAQAKGTVPSPASAAAQSQAGIMGLSASSRPIVVKLSLLFAMDSFGGGLVTGTLLAYYFHVRWRGKLGHL
jgi:hypothetical protein